MNPDKYLAAYGVDYKTLSEDERDTFNFMVRSMQQGLNSTEKVREYIIASKQNLEAQLIIKNNHNPNFLTILCWLIPLIGIVRKWYQDQEDLEIKMKLKVFTSLEYMLLSPERQKEQIERAIANIKPVSKMG